MFSKTFAKCSNCCRKSACRGQIKSVLGNLGNLGGRTKGLTNIERGLHPTLPNQAKLNKITYHHQLLCKSPQEPVPVGGIASADEQKCSRVGQKARVSMFLQVTIFGPKTEQEMETYTRSQQSEQIPQAEKFKMETPETIRTSLQMGEWVTSIDFKDAYFHILIQSQSRVYLISCTGANISIQSNSIWSVHSTHGVHDSDQRGITDDFTERYRDPPVPRRLVGPYQIPPNLSPACTDTSSYLSESRLVS